MAGDDAERPWHIGMIGFLDGPAWPMVITCVSSAADCPREDMARWRWSPAWLWRCAGMRLVRSALRADAAVDPLAEQIGVAEVAGILLDHVQYHLAQRDGRAVWHRAADSQVG